MATLDINTLLSELVGQRCEGVHNPYGSILLLDIGPLGIRPPAVPGQKQQGWRALTVESPWRLASAHEVLCDWNDEGGTGGALTNRIAPLVGKTVLEISTAPPGWDLRIRFSDDLELFVFSDSSDDQEEAWFILGTDGLTVSGGPEREGKGGLKIERLPTADPKK